MILKFSVYWKKKTLLTTKKLLQISYSWPPTITSSPPPKINSVFVKKLGCNGPKGAIVQSLKQRQWRHIIPPTPNNNNNWSLNSCSSVVNSLLNRFFCCCCDLIVKPFFFIFDLL